MIRSQARGRLKVFLGYASGVGKSFRMLDEGRRRRERGQDVVAGALQPEIPEEIRPLLNALEIVPTLDVDGVPVMDVPAILRRHPQVCLVDGLAYDNPEGSRNAHRWQDVEELLAAGISVVGSVNLQYIDDQREAVEKITGKKVTQTIPRAFLNTADEIVIVDTPPSEASPRLSALREKALLLSADVIDAGLQRYLHAHGIEAAWGTHEHFLVYLTPGANVGPYARQRAPQCRAIPLRRAGGLGETGQLFRMPNKEPSTMLSRRPGLRARVWTCWRAKIRWRPSCSMRARTA